MKTVFLLGAGFSAAANSYLKLDDFPPAKPYPLVGDLGTECFGPNYNLSQGTKRAFEEAIARKDRGPLQCLVDLIQDADHSVGQLVADDEKSIFLSLVRAFPGAAFLTFNYDSLLELVLLRQNLWTPYDGFGVRAQACLQSEGRIERCYQRSAIHVLHFHGCVYLYPEEIEVNRKQGDPIPQLKLREPPGFVFDLDALANRG